MNINEAVYYLFVVLGLNCHFIKLLNMSEDIKWQMNCCICCNGPITPSADALRKDGLGARALLYIQGQALKFADDWNLDPQSKPNILSKKEDLHIFHESNTKSVIEMFKEGGAAEDMWLDGDTPFYKRENFADRVPRSITRAKTIAGNSLTDATFTGVVPPTMIYFSTTKFANYRAVQWARPTTIAYAEHITELIHECITNVGVCRYIPSTEYTVAGCKSCNDIMTLEATTSHFLVRHVISDYPLVPREAILSVKLSGTVKNNDLKFETPDSKYRWDPNESNEDKDPADFTYQACLAYFIHRCMPKKNQFKFGTGRSRSTKDKENEKALHSLNAAISFLLLEIACLQFERMKGCQGGKQRRRKAGYRYRGCAEMYLSYVFYIFLSNDNVEGEEEGKDGRHCSMDFAMFHRYIFLDVIQVVVLALPEYAGGFEILDVVFGELLNGGGVGPLVPTARIAEPAIIIGHMCKAIPKFYREVLKPIFSRHLAAMEPNPELLPLNPDDSGSDEEDAILYNKQRLTYNMMMDTGSAVRIMHIMEKTIVGQIDTFINCVGIHGVLMRWKRLLEMAPTRTEKLLDEFIDNETLKEYRNIQLSMRPDSFQPTISLEGAETVYLMCNALELPSEPSTKEELELLKIAPKCSEMRAIERLVQAGIINEDDKENRPPNGD